VSISSQRLLGSLAPESIVHEVHRTLAPWLEQRVSPGAAERDRTGTPFSRELLREAGELGLLGFTVPREVGGAGRSWREWGWFLHEIAYLCSDTSLPMLLAYCGTLIKLLHESGRPELVDRYVRPMTRGERLPGFCWSEGRDALSFRTTLRRSAHGFVLAGEKLPIADGMLADVFLVFARSEETGDVVAVLVERGDPGVETTPYLATGLRAAGMARLRMHAVELPADRVLVANDGLSFGQRFLNDRRLEMPCWALGRMRALCETAVHELAQRVRYGLPVTEMQAVQATIGRMVVSIESSRLVIANALEHIAGQAHDPYWDPPLALTKLHVVEQALVVCRALQDILGGAAVFEAGPYERTIRDLSCLNPIAGTLATLQVDLGIRAITEIEQRLRGAAGRAQRER
jgi:alkylation response protein AidB-like acyl-CoA dehydrogenase